MFYMTNRLGAWQIGANSAAGKVEFKLFFPSGPEPHIRSIRVAGDFQSAISMGADWDFAQGLQLVDSQTQDGTFWRCATAEELPAGFYQYKYQVTFTDGSQRIVTDPCARYGGAENRNAAFVIGGSTPAQNAVEPLQGGRKHLRDLIVYEMMIDDFTDEYRGERAPLIAAIDKLPYLKDLGFNAILFMPWTAWKNTSFDWGYEPFQYFAVEYRYTNSIGQPSEKLSLLKKLISECHRLGFHVIMDGVFNHVSIDFPYKALYLDPETCPYTGSYGGQFPGLQDLNFANACTNEFVRDVCLYWIDTFKIDGIRFDNTTNFYVAGDPNGLPRLLETIDTHMNNHGEQNFSLTLEHLAMDASQLTRETKATSYWDKALHDCAFDYLWRGQIDSRLLNTLNNQRFLGNAEKVPTTYLSSHDESRTCWQAGAPDNVGSMKWYKAQPYVIALYTCPATPMVPNGEEFGEDHWLPGDDRGTGRRVIPRPLRWKLSTDEIGRKLLELYRCMGEIRGTHAGLRSPNFYPQPWDEWQTQPNPEGYGIDVARQLVVFHRWGQNKVGRLQRFVIVLNFSDREHHLAVPFPANGVWVDLLSGYRGIWKPQVHDYRLELVAGSNWGHVFFKED